MTARCVLSSIIFAATLQNAAATASQSNSLSRAVSVSRQFSAFASSPLLAPAMCLFAEHVKREILARLNLQDQWRDPILLLVTDHTGNNSPPLSLETFVTELHLKYQISGRVPPPLNQSQFAAYLVEALCLEFANRHRPAPVTAEFRLSPVPLWIVRGFGQMITDNAETLLAVGRRSVAAGRPSTAIAMIKAQRLPEDPADALLFDANAWLLLESVLALPNGSAKLKRLLISGTNTEEFATIFSDDFKNDAAREKWWSLELFRRTAANPAEQLSPERTAQRLDEILLTKLKDDGGETRIVPLAGLRSFYEQPWLPEVLRDKLNRLDALRSDTHPMQRPVLDIYREAIVQLKQQHLNRFQRALSRADQLRAKTQRELQQISDFLDDAEGRYSTENPVAEFRGYFRTLEQIEAAQQNRRSPIRDYLDNFER